LVISSQEKRRLKSRIEKWVRKKCRDEGTWKVIKEEGGGTRFLQNKGRFKLYAIHPVVTVYKLY
jgi:hypothetical protein